MFTEKSLVELSVEQRLLPSVRECVHHHTVPLIIRITQMHMNESEILCMAGPVGACMHAVHSVAEQEQTRPWWVISVCIQ